MLFFSFLSYHENLLQIEIILIGLINRFQQCILGIKGMILPFCLHFHINPAHNYQIPQLCDYTTKFYVTYLPFHHNLKLNHFDLLKFYIAEISCFAIFSFNF